MNNKLKVIGFGIGTSAKDYLSLYRNEYDILALSDWDESTHGTQRYGLNIISPNQFDQFNYDKILILSTYVDEILEQLENKLQIKREQIVIPLKHKIKGIRLPFEDSKTLEFAHELIFYFSDLFRKSNLPIFLDFGSLLGIRRDGDLIAWDDDIDFSYNENDAMEIEKILLNNYKQFPKSDKITFNCLVKRDTNGYPFYFGVHFNDKNQEGYNNFEIAFGLRSFINKLSVCMRGDFLSCPDIHFKNVEQILWKGQQITVPFNHREYIDILYPNWEIPEMKTFESYHGTTTKIDKEKMKIVLTEEKLF